MPRPIHHRWATPELYNRNWSETDDQLNLSIINAPDPMSGLSSMTSTVYYFSFKHLQWRLLLRAWNPGKPQNGQPVYAFRHFRKTQGSDFGLVEKQFTKRQKLPKFGPQSFLFYLFGWPTTQWSNSLHNILAWRYWFPCWGRQLDNLQAFVYQSHVRFVLSLICPQPANVFLHLKHFINMPWYPSTSYQNR